jgi:hypothetical protein
MTQSTGEFFVLNDPRVPFDRHKDPPKAGSGQIDIERGNFSPSVALAGILPLRKLAARSRKG